MFELIALTGGFWFFCFVIFILGLGIISAEMDSFLGACMTIALMALGAELLFSIPMLATIVANPLWIVLYILVYFVIGSAYGIFYRYPNWLKDRSESIGDQWLRYKYECDGKGKVASPSDFRTHKYYDMFRPKNNVDVITTWIVLWPWALFWDLCHKPVRWFYNIVYTSIGKMLDTVGNNTTDTIINRLNK